MEKFDLKKNEKELKQIAKDTKTKADATIFVILNNMQMYNDIVDEYRNGDKAKVYLMYQLNASIGRLYNLNISISNKYVIFGY